MNDWALNRTNPSHRNKELRHLELSLSVLDDLEIIRCLKAKDSKDRHIMKSKFKLKNFTDNKIEYFNDAEGDGLLDRKTMTAPNRTRKTMEELQGSSMWTELEDDYLKTDLEFGKCLYERLGGERVFAYPLPDVVQRCLRMYMEREGKEIHRLAPKTHYQGYIKDDTRKLHPNIADNLVTLGIMNWLGCKWLHGRKPTQAAVREVKVGGQMFNKTPGVWWLKYVCGFKEHVPQS